MLFLLHTFETNEKPLLSALKNHLRERVGPIIILVKKERKKMVKIV